MKVGDYVRTKDYQNIRSRIGKIINQDEKYYYLDIDEDTQIVWEEDTVLKSSPNIIDLIEEDDFINQLRVSEIIKKTKDSIRFMADSDYEFSTELKEKDIKSIVTKECFESMEYKVGE